VEEGKFRKDLFYRLNVMGVILPPLRERKDDLILLSEYFIKKFKKKLKHPVVQIDKEAESLILKASWPGNVRQLENTLYRAIYQCKGDTITADILMVSGIGEATESVYIKPVKQYSKEKLREVLESTGYNKKKTAEVIGISRPTLYKWMKKRNLM
jgi:transcriptional regulator with PAS, ATPase and Fis domain